MATACLLQLVEVVDACSGFLMKQLHPSNCIGIRQFADAQGCRELYRVANEYAVVRTAFLPILQLSDRGRRFDIQLLNC